MALPTIHPGVPLKLAVLISGSGGTLLNLCQRIAAKRLDAKVVQVISSRPGTLGVQRARDLGLPIEVIGRKEHADIDAFSQANLDLVRKSGADLVCLAGFLQFLKIPAEFEDRVINIHPSLLPSFGGKGMYGHHVHEAVVKAGCKVSGCTVHFADNEFDHGPILVQRTCPVLADDTPDTLAQRVYAQECEAYPEAIQALAQGRVFKRENGTFGVRG
jgi:phosphoribosylglycinamide formyltransferase 1